MVEADLAALTDRSLEDLKTRWLELRRGRYVVIGYIDQLVEQNVETTLRLIEAICQSSSPRLLRLRPPAAPRSPR